MKTSIRELRTSTKSILNSVKQGKEVLVYSHKQPIAKIVPFYESDVKKQDYGFGMWADRGDIKDVENFARKLRKGRRHAV